MAAIPDDVLCHPIARGPRGLLLELWHRAEGEPPKVEIPQDELARVFGVTARSVRAWVRSLREAGLVELRPGSTKYRLFDPGSFVPEERKKDAGQMSDADRSAFFRARAQVGGLRRVNEAQKVKITDLEDQLDAALQRGRYRPKERVNELGALLADAKHSADCVVPGCERCLAALERLEVERGVYVDAADVADRLEAYGVLTDAVGAWFAARRSRTPGAQAGAVVALRALEHVMRGETEAGRRALEGQ